MHFVVTCKICSKLLKKFSSLGKASINSMTIARSKQRMHPSSAVKYKLSHNEIRWIMLFLFTLNDIISVDECNILLHNAFNTGHKYYKSAITNQNILVQYIRLLADRNLLYDV